jgi:hypothetical protein
MNPMTHAGMSQMNQDEPDGASRGTVCGAKSRVFSIRASACYQGYAEADGGVDAEDESGSS